MQNAVVEATQSFFEMVLGTDVLRGKTKGKNFYGASISLYENSHEHMWYLFFKKDTLNFIAKNLLCEDNLCEDDLDDLLKEIANQLIGPAKVILEGQYPNTNFTLGVPEFMGNVSFPFPFALNNPMIFKVKNRTFILSR